MGKQNAERLVDFYTGEYQNMVRFLRRRAGDLSLMEAEDVIGDLMLSLVARTDLTSGIENLAAYIYRALGNRLTDWLRRRKHTVPLEAGAEENEAAVRLSAARGDTEAEAANRELRRRLLAALDGLPPKQRAVWLATEIEDYSFRELAEMWDEPLGTLLARKHRAVEALRQALGDLRQA